MTSGSSNTQRPPITEAVGEAMAKEVKGPPVDAYAPEVPMAFLQQPSSQAQVDPETLTRTRRKMVAAAVIVVVVLAVLLIGKAIA